MFLISYSQKYFKIKFHFIIVLVIFVLSGNLAKYEISNVELKLLKDGFRVSIPKIILSNPSKLVNSDNKYESLPTITAFTRSNICLRMMIFFSCGQMCDINNPYTITSDIDKVNTSNAMKVVCTPSITIVQNRNTCKGQLIFEDNFDTEINASIWKQEVRLPLDAGDTEFVLYETIAKIDTGLLKIKPILWNEDRPGTDIKYGQLDLGARCTGIQNRELECERLSQGQVSNVLPPVVSARINTKYSFSFKYGRVEIRAKLPKGDWLFPLLLLEPLTNQYGQNSYTSGQMRIAFARGNSNLTTQNGIRIDGHTLYGGAVLTPESEFRDKSMVNIRQNDHYGNEFHVYSLIWDNRKLTLKVDGLEYGHVDGGFSSVYSADSIRSDAWKAGGYMAPFDEEFFVTLGVSAGGHGDFPDDTLSKPWLNTSPKATIMFWRDRENWKSTWNNPELLVDYVRVYAI